jgi:hypothetical protein
MDDGEADVGVAENSMGLQAYNLLKSSINAYPRCVQRAFHWFRKKSFC